MSECLSFIKLMLSFTPQWFAASLMVGSARQQRHQGRRGSLASSCSGSVASAAAANQRQVRKSPTSTTTVADSAAGNDTAESETNEEGKPRDLQPVYIYSDSMKSAS